MPGKPPHGAQPHVARHGNNSRPSTAQQCYDRSAMGAGTASTGAPGGTQTRYGQFSLDESCARLAGGPQPQAVLQSSMQAGAGVWPAGTSLCNSLSTPTAFECMTAVSAKDAVMMQEDSWASTVSGDVCMLPAGGDPTDLLAGAEALQAMQRQQECQLLLTQQQEQERLHQQHQRQLLRAQMGLMPAASPQQFANQPVSDSSLLAQLQCSGLTAQNPSGRRASFGPCMLSPADLSQAGRACSLPLAGMQLPQLVPSSSPFVGNGIAFSGADAAATAADVALEAEIDGALQRLLLLRNEVEVSKAQARASRSSIGNSSFYNGAAPLAAVSGGSLAATSSLYQPYNPAAAGVLNSAADSAAQLAAVSVTAGPRTSFSSFAPVMSAVDARGFAPQRLAASAAAAVMYEVSGGAAVNPMGPPIREPSMADFLAYGMPSASPVGLQAGSVGMQAGMQAGSVSMQAGPAMSQTALGQELQLLALRQAAVSAAGQAYGPAGVQMALPLLPQPR